MVSHIHPSSFKKFCIVGLGNHARTKLIPAVLANGQTLVGLVSSRAFADLPNVPVFARIEDALAALPLDTVFIIATPPALHLHQAMEVLAAGRDVIVEKPAFITEADARSAIALAAKNDAVLVEAFMHRHTELYAKFMGVWVTNHASIEAIEMVFVVPQMPSGTFRQDGAVESSALYDIGSYVLSLLADLNLPLDAVDLARVDHPGDGFKEAMLFSGEIGSFRVEARIGIRVDYANQVLLRLRDGRTISFAPFFYGRFGQKTITTQTGDHAAIERLDDVNAFERMLAVPREIWRADQSRRADQLTEVTTTLQRLGIALAAQRNDADATGAARTA